MERGEQDVYYLPCNMETPGNRNAARMDFTIPHDKAILISVTNGYAAVPKSQVSMISKATVLKQVKGSIDIITDKSLEVDGVDMVDKVKRVRSDFFSIDNDNLAMTDGYWLHLPPNTLAPGKHTIYRSSCNSQGTEASTHYEITVT